MTDDMRPLPMLIKGVLGTADWAIIKEAKDSLDLPYLVKPVQAVPGSPGRILCIGVHPAWACDYFALWSAQSPAMRDALTWVLGTGYDARAVTMADAISGWLDAPVKEIEDDGRKGLDIEFGARGQYDPNEGDKW